jgi:CheY-like chemotaxis protein
MSTVLLLERDEEAAFVLDSMLTSLGCEMDHCTHPHEALFSLQDSIPDLLLLSMPLRGMSASAFLSSLKSIASFKDTPVVGMADQGSEHETELSALARRGLSGHLQRPVTRADLTTMLSRWASPDRPAEASPPAPPSPAAQARPDMSLAEKPGQPVSVASVSSVLHHSIGRPRKPEPPAPAPAQPRPQPDVAGPKLQAYFGGERREMTIEMAIGKSMMVWAEGERMGIGVEFGAELTYKDPAPGRNRMIKLDLKLTVGNSSPAGDGCFRCSLRVDDVRPAERWKQFVRVCKASTADSS